MSCAVIVLPFIPTATLSPNGNTLAIVLAVVVPVIILIVVLLAVSAVAYCHRKKIGKFSLSAAHRAPYYTEVATALYS